MMFYDLLLPSSFRVLRDLPGGFQRPAVRPRHDRKEKETFSLSTSWNTFSGIFTEEREKKMSSSKNTSFRNPLISVSVSQIPNLTLLVPFILLGTFTTTFLKTCLRFPLKG